MGARSGTADEPAAAAELAEELGDLPLALAQAAAYIDTRAVTVGGYLNLYRDPALARRLRDEGLESEEYPASVARTWLLSIGAAVGERPAAVELLRLCAFLDPDDIDLELLAAGAAQAGEPLAAALGDRLERGETAGALARASLVTVPAQGRLRVHRLVQAVTRDQLADDQAAAWARRAAEPGSAVFPARAAGPFVVAGLGEPGSSCGVSRRRTQKAIRTWRAQRGSLLGGLGIYLAASAQFRAARSALERALAIKEAVYGPRGRRTLVNLGIVQQKLGELPAARASLERALAIEEAAYGPDHPEVASTLDNLGDVQQQLGELPAARATLERALAIEEAAYGPDHPEVARTLASLGRRPAGAG